MMPSTDEYRCEICTGIFEKGWSDEETQLEKEGLWGELVEGNSMTICDECFNELFPTAYGVAQ